MQYDRTARIENQETNEKQFDKTKKDTDGFDNQENEAEDELTEAFEKYDTAVTYNEKVDKAILFPWDKQTLIGNHTYKLLPHEQEKIIQSQLSDGYEKDIVISDHGEEKIAVYGDPFNKYEMVVSRQGINKYEIKSDCGLVACTNAINIYNEEKSLYDRKYEKEVVDFAVKNNLCDMNGEPQEQGGTTIDKICAVLDHYEVPFDRYEGSQILSLRQLAERIKEGDTALISVAARDIWEPSSFLTAFSRPKPSDHAICVTGVAYDIQEDDGVNTLDENIKGFYIVDSGRGEMNDKARFLSYDIMSKAYWKDGKQIGNDIHKMCLIVPQKTNKQEVV